MLCDPLTILSGHYAWAECDSLHYQNSKKTMIRKQPEYPHNGISSNHQLFNVSINQIVLIQRVQSFKRIATWLHILEQNAGKWKIHASARNAFHRLECARIGSGPTFDADIIPLSVSLRRNQTPSQCYYMEWRQWMSLCCWYLRKFFQSMVSFPHTFGHRVSVHMEIEIFSRRRWTAYAVMSQLPPDFQTIHTLLRNSSYRNTCLNIQRSDLWCYSPL